MSRTDCQRISPLINLGLPLICYKNAPGYRIGPRSKGICWDLHPFVPVSPPPLFRTVLMVRTPQTRQRFRPFTLESLTYWPSWRPEFPTKKLGFKPSYETHVLLHGFPDWFASFLVGRLYSFIRFRALWRITKLQNRGFRIFPSHTFI